MTTVAPNPVELFINQVSVEYNTDIARCKRGHPYIDYVRPTAIYILYVFYGLPITKLATLFNIRTQGVYYNLNAAKDHPEEYQKILTIFIDTMKRFINLNKDK